MTADRCQLQRFLPDTLEGEVFGRSTYPTLFFAKVVLGLRPFAASVEKQVFVVNLHRYWLFARVGEIGGSGLHPQTRPRVRRRLLLEASVAGG